MTVGIGQSEELSGCKNIPRVCIAGVEGSGKTVLMSQLGYLFTRRVEDSVFLEQVGYNSFNFIDEVTYALRHRSWPPALLPIEPPCMTWNIHHPVSRTAHETVCQLTLLDYPEAVYRAAFENAGNTPLQQDTAISAKEKAWAEELRQYIAGGKGMTHCDVLIILVNLKNVIDARQHENSTRRRQDERLFSKGIMDCAFNANVPSVCIAFTQADTYAYAFTEFDDIHELYEHFLPEIAAVYPAIPLFRVSAVTRTVSDTQSGNIVPAEEFCSTGLNFLMEWMVGSVPGGKNVAERMTAARQAPARSLVAALNAMGEYRETISQADSAVRSVAVEQFQKAVSKAHACNTAPLSVTHPRDGMSRPGPARDGVPFGASPAWIANLDTCASEAVAFEQKAQSILSMVVKSGVTAAEDALVEMERDCASKSVSPEILPSPFPAEVAQDLKDLSIDGKYVSMESGQLKFKHIKRLDYYLACEHIRKVELGALKQRQLASGHKHTMAFLSIIAVIAVLILTAAGFFYRQMNSLGYSMHLFSWEWKENKPHSSIVGIVSSHNERQWKLMKYAGWANKTDDADRSPRMDTENLETSLLDFDLSLGKDCILKMLAVHKGSFQMGSPDGTNPAGMKREDGRDNDEVWHNVILTDDFWLGETEVTQAQWRIVMSPHGSYYPAGSVTSEPDFKGDDLPMDSVSWHEAKHFCLLLNERFAAYLPLDYQFDLPTEAEWEYACRAGTTTSLNNGENMKILGLNNSPNLDNIAWYGGNCGQQYDSSWGGGGVISTWEEMQYNDVIGGTHPVAQKLPNQWGFYDMLGNVGEWCLDSCEWDSGVKTNTYRNGIKNPLCRNGHLRVRRGGGWSRQAIHCRVAYRISYEPENHDSDLGFRLALVRVR